MFKFFSNITLRTLYKRGLFPIINVLGLSIGLTVVLLISLLVFHERSFDKGFKEGKHIYRINSKLTAYMPGETLAMTANAVGPAIQDAIPDVNCAVRTFRFSYYARIKDNPIHIEVRWADKDFFKLFDTPFIHGTPEDVMSRPNAIAISEQMAKTLYGNDNPIGETFLIFNLDDHYPVEVVAVYRDYPGNSSFREFKVIAPFKLSQPSWIHETEWGNINFETFCLLNVNADTARVNAQMRKTIMDATAGIRDGDEWWYYPQLQRLEDIHLYSAKFYGGSFLSSISDIEAVKMLTLLSVIILLVACINYMNLSTARAQKRSREIGISKTIGAKRREIIIRLTFETAIFTFISFILAFLMAWFALPVLNTLLGEQLSVETTLQPGFLGVALLIWVFTTLLAASYPVLYMSGFPPLFAIRSQFMTNSSHAVVRKVLTVGQFAVAIVLIAWVLIIQAQIMFINKKDLGYNPQNLIGIWLGLDTEALMNDLKAESSIEMVSRESSYFFQTSVDVLIKNADDKTGITLTNVATDPNFIDLMQIKLIAGRPLPEQQAGDTIIQILLNRTAVEYLEMTPEEAIGKRVLAHIGTSVTEVCGVVENFNFEPLYRPIGAFCFHNHPKRVKNFVVFRAKKGNMQEQLKIYEQIYKKHFPNENFSPQFFDSLLEKYYSGERRFGQIVLIFSILAIFVACMGVFGLTAFMAEQRTKEIGIRKVLGASIQDIVRLFTNSYVKLLGISLIIAIPAAWWVGNQYLQNFAYRISIGWWIFAVAALITVVLTLLTISLQAIKAATRNPVEAVKSE